MLIMLRNVSSLWAAGVDANCMNIGLHQIAESSIYHTVARQRLDTFEAARDDPYFEMAATVPRSRVPRVSRAVIDYLQELRSKSLFEPCSDSLDAIAHGNTCTTGLISTLANTFSTT
jgi:hypothetical protein